MGGAVRGRRNTAWLAHLWGLYFLISLHVDSWQATPCVKALLCTPLIRRFHRLTKMNTLLKVLLNILKQTEGQSPYSAMGRLKHSSQDCPSNQLCSLTYISYHYDIYQEWSGLRGLLQIKLYLPTPFIQTHIKCTYYVPGGLYGLSLILKNKTKKLQLAYILTSLCKQRNNSSRDVNVTTVI